MPVYLFTYHTYRSWMPDHPRGFTIEDEGYQAPDPKLARQYADASKHAPYDFDAETERFAIECARECCERRDWTVYAAATETTHLHLLVGWRSDLRWNEVRGKIKNIVSLQLSKRNGEVGRPRFCEGASRKKVEKRDHFEYLIEQYLLNHSGWRWDERRDWTAPSKKQG